MFFETWKFNKPACFGQKDDWIFGKFENTDFF